MRALTTARSTREQDERRNNELVLGRLSDRGRTIRWLAESLGIVGWIAGTTGVRAVLSRLAGEDLAHERDGLWFAGPHPNPPPRRPLVIERPPPETTPRLTYGPATLPKAGGVSRPVLVERPHERARPRDEDDAPPPPPVAGDEGPAPAPELVEVDAPAVDDQAQAPGPPALDQVFDDLRQHPGATRGELAARTGQTVAEVGAALRKLRTAGAVRSTGPGRGSRWSLSAPAPAEVPPSGGDDPVADEQDVEFEIRVCMVCGCTDDDCSECAEAQGYPCAWVTDSLCSRCVQEGAVRRLEELADQAERTAAHLRECIAALRLPREEER